MTDNQNLFGYVNPLVHAKNPDGQPYYQSDEQHAMLSPAVLMMRTLTEAQNLQNPPLAA